MSELTKMIKVLLWELKEIADTLRMVANALNALHTNYGNETREEFCID